MRFNAGPLSDSFPDVKAQDAVAEIHDRLAGRGEKSRGQLIKPTAALRENSRLTHALEMTESRLIAASGGFSQFGNAPSLAAGEFAQDHPSCRVAQYIGQLFDGNDRRSACRSGFGSGVHGRTLKKRAGRRKNSVSGP